MTTPIEIAARLRAVNEDIAAKAEEAAQLTAALLHATNAADLGNQLVARNRYVVAAAAACGVSPADVTSRRRTARVALARKLVYLQQHETGLNFSEIARIMDRDPAAVLAGIASLRGAIESGDKFAVTAWKNFCDLAQ